MQNRTTERELLVKRQAEEMNIVPQYIDDDLVVIDNVKLLAQPNAVYTNMNLLAYCSKGMSQISVNGEQYEIHACEIFICPPEMSLENILISPDFEYQAICISSRLLQIALNDYIKVWNQLVYIQKIRIIKTEEDDNEIRINSTQLLKVWLEREVNNDIEVKYRAEIIKGLVSTTLLGLCFRLHKQIDESVDTKQNVSLFNRFLELLQTTENKHQTVDYYASRLCISSKYLTIICKKNSGKTANEWIQEYKLSAIINYLRTTDWSIKEISNLLGFPNTSFFGKYVKDHLGCSPLEYRKKRKNGDKVNTLTIL